MALKLHKEGKESPDPIRAELPLFRIMSLPKIILNELSQLSSE